MARFPKTEAEIIVAAQVLIGGVTANPAFYPAPPAAQMISASHTPDAMPRQIGTFLPDSRQILRGARTFLP